MNIDEAMRAVNDEYNRECIRAREDRGYGALLESCVAVEYEELDKELPGYVAEIASAYGAQPGTLLEPWIYQMARMCFRMGMRTQRKIDRPDQPTSIFWRSDQVNQ